MLGKNAFLKFLYHSRLAILSCQLKQRYINCLGATMIETAILLPLVLLIFFFMIWLGVMSNTQGIFKQSVGNALMLASTRGDVLLMRKDIIPEFATWVSGPPPREIRNLLAWDKAPVTSWSAPASWGSSPESVMQNITLKNVRLAGNASPPSINAMPERYIYTLIYIYQSLRQGIGNELRYPCADINASTPDDYLSQSTFAGCLVCRFDDPANGNNLFNVDTSNVQKIKISCYFRPNETILRPLASLIDIVSKTTGAGSNPLVMKLTRTIDPSVGLIP